MKILMVSPFLPYPEAKSGAPRAIFDRLQILSRRHSVTLATFAIKGEAAHLAALKQLGVRVSTVTRNEVTEAKRGPLLWRKRARLALGLLVAGRPVLVQEFQNKALCNLVCRLSREQRFDVVMLEHILAAQYAACIEDTGAPIILTEHDIQTAFPTRKKGVSRGRASIERMFEALDRVRWRAYAAKAYRGSSMTLVPTEADAKLLRRHVPGARAEIVPFGLATAPTSADIAPRQTEPEREQDTLLFVGNFDHPPNRDAAYWLCREILPAISQRRLGVKLWLVGRNPTPDMNALSNAQVSILGEVPSVEWYLQRCTLFVAPLREGGGMRIKLLEALNTGTPAVTTTLGASGLDAENGRHLLIADGTANFVRATLRALADAGLRDGLGKEGKALALDREKSSMRAVLLENVLATIATKRSSAATAKREMGGVGV